ncbi:hypothetical protein PQI66_09245 [Corynebacterium sp. USCH3]|uniref:hypothetical protein n=1 Tax=Corynebacterium sp. USCH3 TaxID=3024840 RepID=UPI00309A8452
MSENTGNTGNTAHTETTESTTTPRRKRKGLAVGAGAVAALLLAGGVAYGVSENSDDDGNDSVRTVAAENRADNDGAPATAGTDAASFRDAAEQAIAEAGGTGASSVDVEGAGHEVEVELDDGGSAEVHVAADGAMRIETEGPDPSDQQDPVLDLDALDDAVDAAVAAAADAGVSDGTVDSVSASDDRGVTYEVSVQGQDGREVDVDLADDFSVVATDLDD